MDHGAPVPGHGQLLALAKRAEERTCGGGGARCGGADPPRRPGGRATAARGSDRPRRSGRGSGRRLSVGNWGNGVWQDDGAAEVILMFKELLEGGRTPREAVQGVLADPPWGWGDQDDDAVQVLAIAALALQ